MIAVMLLRTQDVLTLIQAAASGNGSFDAACRTHPRTAHSLKAGLDAFRGQRAAAVPAHDPHAETGPILAALAAALERAAHDAGTLAMAEGAADFEPALKLAGDAGQRASESRNSVVSLRNHLRE